MEINLKKNICLENCYKMAGFLLVSFTVTPCRNIKKFVLKRSITNF